METYRDILSVVTALGGIGIILGLLDWFLSENAKARLATWSIRVWNWVDEAKKVSYFAIFTSQKWQRIFLIISSFLAIFLSFGGIWLSIHGFMKEFGLFSIVWFTLQTVIVIIFNLAVFPRLTRYLYQRIDIKSFMLLLAFINISAAVIMLLLLSLFRQMAFSIIGGIGNVDDLFQFFGLLIFFGSTIGLFVLTLWIPFLIIGIFVYAVLALVLLVYLLLYPLELVLRRVAEYPTGPLLAVSALIAALGELAKLLIPDSPT